MGEPTYAEMGRQVISMAAEIADLRAKLDKANDGLIEYARQITQAEARVRRLEEALRRVVDDWNLDSDYFQACNYDQARAALAPENPGA